MKKHLFSLGAFMASTLVTTNALLVISCIKKTIKNTTNDDKDDEKNTETIINQKAAELKDKIRNIIDKIITNTNVGEWIIDLKKEYASNYKNIISKLKAAVDILRSKVKEEDQQMLLADVSKLDQKFIDKINAKFTSLKDLIISKISESDITDASNLEFDLVSDSIIPILTNLNGNQVIKAIAILEQQQKSKISFSSNSMAKNLSYAATNKKDIELFKVKTNLKYSFKIVGKQFEGEYHDVELLLAGDSDTLNSKREYTQKTIAEMLAKYKEVKIYGGENDKDWAAVRGYDHLGNKMDWDFSKVVVRNEIASLQFERFKALEGFDKTFKDNLEIKSAEKVDFNIDSSNYMIFDNHNRIDSSIDSEDNILVKNSHYEKLKNNLDIMKDEKEAVTALHKQFFSDNDSAVNKWNGGKINDSFIFVLKVNSTGTNPKIKLDEYYGLGEKSDDDKYNPIRNNKMLIGYGTTDIRGAKYAGLPLATMTIDTNIIASFKPGMKELYDNMENYVGTIVKALKGDMRVGKASYVYYFDWQFPNEGEWDAIMAEVTKPEGDKTVTFDWIMENVLKNIRILGKEGKKKYELPINNIPEEAWSFLRTVDEVRLMKREEKENDEFLTTVHDYSWVRTPLYVKYGPFVIYLVGDDVVVTFDDDRNRGIIGRIFS